MHKFLLIVKTNRGEEVEEYDSYEDAEFEMSMWREGLSAGEDVYECMGDIDDNEIICSNEVEYTIKEIDEDGNVVEEWYF